MRGAPGRSFLGPALAGLLVIGLPPAGPARAEDEPLITDRPDFTESAETVAPGRFQLEAGATFERQGELERTALGEALLRIGLSRSWELRLAPNSFARQGDGRDFTGLEDPAVGLKVRLLRGGRARPDLALLAATTLPAGSAEFREPHPQPELTLALAWALAGGWGLGSNLNFAYRSEDGEQFGELSGSLAAGRSWGRRGGAYLEVFAFEPREGRGSIFANGGITYLLSPDLQLDLRVGQGFNADDPAYFLGAGVSWRR